ncbi:MULTISPECIES: glycosyltransferase [unclassified Pseudomonas]|uniref:glycosyltransferase n=1 Tax=unclassified Pseudomonas TaxID=196821 RepID=UPI0007ED67B9|nr:MULTISPECIES: glycosyltransferase [unclassified Pseudomonas]OBP11909.1 hypothetical protein BAE52_07490 [Pseudomonas sp. EGD-AKN5]QOF86326.1 glycosyltransferase [Pseudomonas sp. ADPe]
MKILHITEAWKGGISTYVKMLIEHQVQSGHNVYLAVSRDAEELPNCNVIKYTSSRSVIGVIRASHEISRIYNSLTPDIIHAHSTFSGIYARFKKSSFKLIYTPHAWSFLKKDSPYISRKIYSLIERTLSRRTSIITCMSLEEIEEAIIRGIPKEKLRLIYTGVPKLDITLNPVRTSGAIKIGFFGRLDYQKGFDILLSAAKNLAPHIQIHIFGEAVRGGVPSSPHDRFQYHGWIEQKQVSSAMQEMDIILIPSRWEGFALTPLEAMRAGRGVIISKSSSLPETVISGFNGIILEDLSPHTLSSVLNSLTRETCHKLSINAKKVFDETFTATKFLEQLDEAYKF